MAAQAGNAAGFTIDSELAIVGLSGTPDSYLSRKVQFVFGSDILYETVHYPVLLQIFDNCLQEEGEVYLFSKMFYFGNTGSVYEFLKFVEGSKRFTAAVVHQFEDKVGGNVRAVIKMTRKEGSRTKPV